MISCGKQHYLSSNHIPGLVHSRGHRGGMVCSPWGTPSLELKAARKQMSICEMLCIREMNRRTGALKRGVRSAQASGRAALPEGFWKK